MKKDPLENVSEVPLTQTRKYRVLVRVRGEDGWTGNQLRFDSWEEAAQYGRDLYSVWMAVEEWKVEEQP